jgi:hypothetical protein
MSWLRPGHGEQRFLDLGHGVVADLLKLQMRKTRHFVGAYRPEYLLWFGTSVLRLLNNLVHGTGRRIDLETSARAGEADRLYLGVPANIPRRPESLRSSRPEGA